MEVHDLEGFRFSFIFYYVLDLQKVLDGGPWSFEQNLLVYHQMVANEDSRPAKLQEVDGYVGTNI